MRDAQDALGLGDVCRRQAVGGLVMLNCFFQAEDGIRVAQGSRGLGDVYKRQVAGGCRRVFCWQSVRKAQHRSPPQPEKDA